MKFKRFALAAAGLGLLAVSTVPVQAVASPQADPKPGRLAKLVAKQREAAGAAAAPCGLDIAKLTARGTASWLAVVAGRPPVALQIESRAFFATRANATWYRAIDANDNYYAYGLALQGANLYRQLSYYDDEGQFVRLRAIKIGGGWTSFRSIATSNVSTVTPRHAYLYGLNTNGRLYRYAQSGTAYKAHGSFPGFASFKAMTVISENPTYDTLLMTTTRGALYTIRIPVAAGAKPVVKQVRKSGWAAYESLVVQGCGARGGALVLGADHDTDAADLYAMSKANGLSTAITAYGKVPPGDEWTFDGVSHVSWTSHYDRLVSE